MSKNTSRNENKFLVIRFYKDLKKYMKNICIILRGLNKSSLTIHYFFTDCTNDIDTKRKNLSKN